MRTKIDHLGPSIRSVCLREEIKDGVELGPIQPLKTLPLQQRPCPNIRKVEYLMEKNDYASLFPVSHIALVQCNQALIS